MTHNSKTSSLPQFQPFSSVASPTRNNEMNKHSFHPCRFNQIFICFAMCGLECHLSDRVLAVRESTFGFRYSLVWLANPQRLRNKLCADADYLFDYPNCKLQLGRRSLWIFAPEPLPVPFIGN